MLYNQIYFHNNSFVVPSDAFKSDSFNKATKVIQLFKFYGIIHKFEKRKNLRNTQYRGLVPPIAGRHVWDLRNRDDYATGNSFTRSLNII